MRVKCINNELTDELHRAEGSEWRGRKLPVVVGESYPVFGLTWWKGLVWLEIAENDRTVSSVPLSCFEIEDDRVPGEWRIRASTDEHLTLWPELFYERAFHDRLSNGATELVEAFRDLRRRMESR